MRTKVVILDMQPITPAMGGGRQRLLGLYHALGEDIDAVYVGSYDWPGESFRDHQLTPGLREVCVPLSEEHHLAARNSADRYGGRIAIDMEFHRQVGLSPSYLEISRREMREADVVVFSHPWCFPPLAADLRSDQLVVYDSQNVEALLRSELHADVPAMAPTIFGVVEAETALCHRADLVLACSHDDRVMFHQLMGVAWEKLRVVPNGIFVGDRKACDSSKRKLIAKDIGFPPGPIVVFLGSDYGPNNEAARFISSEVARALPDVTFAVMGGCCNAVLDRAENVLLLGVVDDARKHDVLRCASLALNPLTGGSGTSIKMFDFMAAGLPVVATEIGARGIETGGADCIVIAERSGTAVAIANLLADEGRLDQMAVAALEVVRAGYAWELISPSLGRLLKKRHWERQLASPDPTCSVLIPSYERPHLLDRLMERLANQSYRDFEVVVVDQSGEKWPGALQPWPFRLTYIHTDVRGAVRARNTAAHFASGRILAFTDDDCEPERHWLAAGVEAMRDPSVAGVEGLIRSNHLGDPEWRPVTNIGFEGVGFMTANLFVRNSHFQSLDGFDLRFDRPHFREDTDFGWRLQTLGRVPYVHDAEVFHPAQRRDIARESLAERNKFFQKDALLYAKHPLRYRDLFQAEGHFRYTKGFWPNFLEGFTRYGIPLPPWLSEYPEYEVVNAAG